LQASSTSPSRAGIGWIAPVIRVTLLDEVL